MTRSLFTISTVLVLLLSYKGICQDTLQVKIDTAFCVEFNQIDGEFGVYESIILDRGNTRERQIDTLFKSMSLTVNQYVVIPKKGINLKIKFIPTDTLIQEVEMPLHQLNSDDRKITLDCYFFRKPAALLSHMENGDTLSISTEYRGNSHAGMTFDRSEIRIIKRQDKFYYSRNDLPIRGDLVLITFPEGGYEAGFSEEKELSKEQLSVIRNFETDIINNVNYSLEYGMYEIQIKLKGKSYRFIPNMHVRNEDTQTIWESLK